MTGDFLQNNAAVAVDLVVLTVDQDELVALAIRRGIQPFKGKWALPGGFILAGEDLTDAAKRELEEESGIRAIDAHLEQLATYGTPDRDPRGRVIAVAYLAFVPDLPAPVAGSDAAEAAWLPVDRLLRSGRLAFDHRRILRDGLERARSKLEYTSLAASFCGREFTVAELRRVYEVVWGTSIDPRNFHRKATSSTGFLEPTGRSTARDGGRPAQIYRRGSAKVLFPPLLRPDHDHRH